MKQFMCRYSFSLLTLGLLISATNLFSLGLAGRDNKEYFLKVDMIGGGNFSVNSDKNSAASADIGLRTFSPSTSFSIIYKTSGQKTLKGETSKDFGQAFLNNGLSGEGISINYERLIWDMDPERGRYISGLLNAQYYGYAFNFANSSNGVTTSSTGGIVSANAAIGYTPWTLPTPGEITDIKLSIFVGGSYRGFTGDARYSDFTNAAFGVKQVDFWGAYGAIILSNSQVFASAEFYYFNMEQGRISGINGFNAMIKGGVQIDWLNIHDPRRKKESIQPK